MPSADISPSSVIENASSQARGFHEDSVARNNGSVPPKRQDLDKVTDDDDSVLSEYSHSDNDESSLDEPPECSFRDDLLEKEFKARDKALERLTRGIDPIYAQVMRDNEYATRRQMMLLSKKKPNGASSKDSSKPEALSLGSVSNGSNESVGLIQRIRMMTACDLQNTLPGAAHLILYCLAHGSCFQTVEACLVALTRNFKNQDAVAISLLLGSIILLRVTGGMWDYLGEMAHERVKFDMHNRLLLRRMDARVALWFRRHAKLKTLLGLVAFYVALEGLGWLHWRSIELLDRKLMLVLDALRRLLQQMLSGDTCSVDGVCDSNDEVRVNERSYSMYYAASAVGAIGLLQMLGHPFLRR